MKIFVGNLPFRASDEDLRGLFEGYGSVDSARIVTDRETQRSRGFGFVEMSDDAAANSAISNLNGSSFMERDLVVNEAREREGGPRQGGGGFNRGGGGGGFNRGGNSGGGFNRGGGGGDFRRREF